MSETPDKSEKAAGRAARVAAMQKAEKARAKRRTALLIAIPTVVVVGVAGAITAVFLNRPAPPSLDAVTTADYEASQHTTDPVTYEQNPPMGGPHNPTWLNCGVYDAPVPNENAVHSMEHGAVWITYQPDLATDQVDELKDAVADESYTVLSPYEALPSPIVLSAWNNQLAVDTADDPRIDAFLARFVQGAQTPEPGALCSQGVGTPTG